VILSHSKQFIFYRTKKTASSTLEQALALHCQTGDWVSVVYLTKEQKARFAGSTVVEHDEAQPGSVGVPYTIAPPGRGPLQSRLQNRLTENDDWVHGGPAVLRKATADRHPLRRGAALPSYPTIVGVRNPWAWVFSLRQHARLSNVEIGVEEILEGVNNKNPLVEDCTHVVRFEHLQEDVDRLGKALGLPLALERINDRGVPTEDYTSFFDDRTRALVAHRFAPMIERFGYEFGK
jgi:hypothetical protein